MVRPSCRRRSRVGHHAGSIDQRARHGPPARGIGADRDRAGDDRGSGLLGTRSALLVGFAIPTSFMLAFVLLGIMGGGDLEHRDVRPDLAVGMLGRRRGRGGGIRRQAPSGGRAAHAGLHGRGQADVLARRRLDRPRRSAPFCRCCFWPGVPGEFMGMLPVTMIFVLSASLIVALIYLPVLGGVAARFFARDRAGHRGRDGGFAVVWRAAGRGGRPIAYGMFMAAMQTINPGVLFPAPAAGTPPMLAMLPGVGPVRGAVRADVRLPRLGADRTPSRANSGPATGHALRLVHPCHRRQPGHAGGDDRRGRRLCRLGLRLFRPEQQPAWTSSSRPSRRTQSSMSARAATCRSPNRMRWCDRSKRS